jgi:hypothetical protein
MNNSAFATLQRFNKALLCNCYIYFTKAGPVNCNEQRKIYIGDLNFQLFYGKLKCPIINPNLILKTFVEISFKMDL